MPKKVVNLLIVVSVSAFILAGVFSGCAKSAPVTSIQGSVASSSPAATISSPPAQIATSSAVQSAEDVVPGLYPNPIKNSATAQGFTISSIMVENNTDPAGNPVSDHLQFIIQNLTGQTLSNFEVYYTIVDTASGKKEGYYKQLIGFSLSPRGSNTVNFDGKSGVGHYGVNMHGIYGTTVDQLDFKVEVSDPGYAPVYATATKAPGGAEIIGQ